MVPRYSVHPFAGVEVRGYYDQDPLPTPETRKPNRAERRAAKFKRKQRLVMGGQRHGTK